MELGKEVPAQDFMHHLQIKTLCLKDALMKITLAFAQDTAMDDKISSRRVLSRSVAIEETKKIVASSPVFEESVVFFN